MRSEARIVREPAPSVASPPQRAFLGVAAVFLVVPLLFWPTTLSMVRTWYGSATFNHCFFVPLLSLWLIWRARFDLAAVPSRPAWLAVVALAGAGGAWLLGDIAGAMALSQWAMTAMIPLAVAGVFGIRRARVIAFPLLFLFFAVPFGDMLVPLLTGWTADFTVAALRMAGVPVLREGNEFLIPTGRWSVVEACSGIRFLMATVMAGCFFAWLFYRSPMRRALFMGASVVVPIVANWLRATIIVMLGHLSRNEIAAGVDHLVYGWVFFALVLGLLFWVGGFWREPIVEAVASRERRAFTPHGFSGAAATACLGILLIWPLLSAAIAHRTSRGMPAAPVIEARAGWETVDEEIVSWRPTMIGAGRITSSTFTKDGQRVGLIVGQYRDQTQDREMVNSQNRLVVERDRDWRERATGTRAVDVEGRPLVVRSALLAGGRGEVRVLHWYWLGHDATSSDVRAKVDLMLDRLLDRADDGAWIVVFTVETGVAAERVLGRFVGEMGGAVHAALAAAAL